MANRITVNICGEDYTLVAEENTAYMEQVASLVDKKMTEIIAGAKVGRGDAAVLAAVNLADELLKSDLRTEFLGCTADEAAWNTTYGSFEDGTARRMELLNTNHRLTTHNAHGLATALTWFSDTIGLDLTLAPTDQVAMTKETLVLIAMLAAVASLMAVMELLLTTPFFSKAVQPLPGEASVKPNGAWWRGAIITMLLAAATYPFMTQLGHGLLPLPENIFRMTVGNGFLSWYSLLILIMLVTSIIGYQKTKSAARRTAGRAWGSAQLPRRGAWAGACSAAARCWCCACWRICTCCFLSARRHFCWASGSSGRSSRPLTQPGSDSSASIFRSLRCSLS